MTWSNIVGDKPSNLLRHPQTYTVTFSPRCEGSYLEAGSTVIRETLFCDAPQELNGSIRFV